jgi:hypothetical protein
MTRLRPWPALAFGAIALAALAYTGYWFAAAVQIERATADWAASARAQGYAVEHGAIAVGGFPFAFRIDLAAPAVAMAAGPLPWRFRAERLRVTLPPFNPDRLQVVSDAAIELAVGAAADDAVTILSRTARLETRLTPGAPVHVTFESLAAASARYRLPTAAHAEIRVESGAAATVVAAAFRDATVPVAADWPLGPKIERLAATVAFKGAWPDGPIAAALAAWRDEGGIVEVTAFDLAWNGVGASATGTLALDRELRPLAAFAGSVRGLDAAVDAILGAQRLSAAQAAAIKVGVRLLGRKNSQAGADTVEVSATVQDGRVFIGAIPIARVGPVVAP